MPKKKISSVGQVPQAGSSVLPDSREEQFCQMYAYHFNASRAYKTAFSATGLAPGSVRTMASKLLTNIHIRSRLEFIQKSAVACVTVTRERIIEELNAMAFGKTKTKLSEFGKLKALEMVAQIAGVSKNDNAGSTAGEVSEADEESMDRALERYQG